MYRVTAGPGGHPGRQRKAGWKPALLRRRFLDDGGEWIPAYAGMTERACPCMVSAGAIHGYSGRLERVFMAESGGPKTKGRRFISPTL